MYQSLQFKILSPVVESSSSNHLTTSQGVVSLDSNHLNVRLSEVDQCEESSTSSSSKDTSVSNSSSSSSDGSDESKSQPKLLNYLTNTSRSLLKLIGTIAGYQAIFLLDCGATGNFISSGFVSKNNLNPSTLPQPDAITLADGSKQSTGSFLKAASICIGTYTDEVDFVSIPLVGYDVILGMPWLGHYNPNIDWIENTISFEDEKKSSHCLVAATRIPTQMVVEKKGNGSKLNTITSKQLKHQVDRGQIDAIYVVYTEDVERNVNKEFNVSKVFSLNSSSSPAITEVDRTRIKLIDKYRDVFPDELPPGLPPQREIDHKIELIPGSSPPSRPTYRMSATELVELKKQLEELTKIGFHPT